MKAKSEKMGMGITFFIVGLALLVVFSGVVNAESSVVSMVQAGGPTFAVEGYITDGKTYGPIEGAKVCLGENGYCDETDEYGYYLITDIPIGVDYPISVTASGYVPDTGYNSLSTYCNVGEIVADTYVQVDSGLSLINEIKFNGEVLNFGEEAELCCWQVEIDEVLEQTGDSIIINIEENDIVLVVCDGFELCDSGGQCDIDLNEGDKIEVNASLVDASCVFHDLDGEFFVLFRNDSPFNQPSHYITKISELSDLIIPPDGIAFLDPEDSWDINTDLRIQARIENIGGNAYEEDVIVQFFDGYPEVSGENQIGTDQNMEHIAPGAHKNAIVDWTLEKGENNHDIYVIVDPQNVIHESVGGEEDNNMEHTETTIALNYIEGVPCYCQFDFSTVGGICGPRASASVLGYWDDHGYQGSYEFERLVDEGDSLDGDVASLIWMLVEEQCYRSDKYPECEQGAPILRMSGGIEEVCNSDKYENEYGFDARTLLWGDLWQAVKDEIDEGRPLIYLYEHHYNPIFGYLEEGSNKWIYHCELTRRREYTPWDESVQLVILTPGHRGNSGLISIYCPVDLSVTDPDGFIITKSDEITGVTYTETDINGDGAPDDSIIIFDLKTGDYQITVIPEPDAEDTDTYTLEVTAGDTTIVLAEDVQIGDIPSEPYVIESTGTTINAAPVADSNGPYASNEGSEITFDASGSYDPDGRIDLYEWDFDSDGVYDVSSATSTAFFTWGDDHTGTVELRVTDNDGLSDTDTVTITVNNVAPTAFFYVEQPEEFILPYHSLTFNDGSTDAGWLDTHAATWNFGDDTTISGTLTPIGTTTAEHAYVEPGTYTVTLTVTDDNDGTGADTLTITVISAEEAAGIIIDQLEISIAPDEAPKGVSQKIESAIDKLEQVIVFLDQGKYCNAIGKLDGMITQIEGAIDQVNEQKCSVKECKGKECNCIADDDADKLIESLEHAKEGAIAIRDLISAEHPECA